MKHFDEIKEVTGNAVNKIKEFFGGIASWFNDKVVQPVVVSFFSNMWSKLMEGAYELAETVDKVKRKNYRLILANDLKKFRIDHFKKYASLGKNVDNPYSAENIASLLDISKRHYTRIEKSSYTPKTITLEKLLILKNIYDVDLDDFFKEE